MFSFLRVAMVVLYLHSSKNPKTLNNIGVLNVRELSGKDVGHVRAVKLTLSWSSPLA